MVSILHFTVRIFSHYINTKRIKAQRMEDTFPSPEQRVGIASCHNRTVVTVYLTFRGEVESIRIRWWSHPGRACFMC